MYAGCISGALEKEAYLDIIKQMASKISLFKKKKTIIVPDDILTNYLSQEEINQFKQSGSGIYSITVYAEKTKAS